MRATDPGRQSPGLVMRGRRSIAVKRANVSRASGPASRSAANAVVTSSAPAGGSPPSTSARVAVIGSQVASPSNVARPSSSSGRSPWSSYLRTCEQSENATAASAPASPA